MLNCAVDQSSSTGQQLASNINPSDEISIIGHHRLLSRVSQIGNV